MGWKRGTVVMESKPFAHVICQKFSEDRCNYCLKSSEEKLLKCGACNKLMYCGVNCQREDWKIHKTECKIMKRVPNVPTDSIRLFLRLIIRFLKGDGKQKHPNDESPCIRTFNDLMSHRDEIKADQTRSELFRIAADFVRGYTHGILQLPSDDVLLEIFGKMVINTFTIADELLQDVGVAVYTSPSVLDHRCWPNAVASFDGIKVTVRAVDNIGSDSLSDVYLSYVDPLATIEERQEQLQQQYYFTCNCARCTNLEMNAKMCSIEGSNEGDLARVKDCLEKVETMRKNKNNPKEILELCNKCLNEVKLPFGNVYLVRLVGKAFDAAIDAEQWEEALQFGIKNYKAYSILHPPFNPCVGYLLANMGKLLMLFGRLSEAMLHFRKALENFTVSLGDSHYLYRQVTEMMAQCEAELAHSEAQGAIS
ncbi:histone-lysine N-methyltransferase SMYD3-like isoform X1 [Biomphalaria glabrata]|uniref:Histone-lysine N-methyltransferase SMYD3-like isoform X1 n=2 Tax=Biomphalaria glabrata TaxID=6526 RepID=A0A9W3B9Y4_BIOGL|nr:histone-lysine N-methyltransferase SMYD3-like isoform X1 [Biomphalaria glabrata]